MPADRVVSVSGTERGHDTRPGEDHEAGIEAAAAEILNGYERGGTAGGVAKRAIAAYLSRCPSSARASVDRLDALLAKATAMAKTDEQREACDALRRALADPGGS